MGMGRTTAILLMLAATPVLAQNAGDPVAGLARANEVCATCHAVALGDRASPVGEAPPFQVVAETPGMSEIALTAFFQTPHPTMPNLIVGADEARDLIAYILSLRK
jgi:mono/diheme cytochrome c family protein